MERNAGIDVKPSGLRYERVMATVENAIRKGRYGIGEKLPPMKHLSDELDVNVLTVRKALLELRDKGLLEIRHGVGTFVRSSVRKQPNKTAKIAVVFREYMQDIEENHNYIGSVLSSIARRCRAPEAVLQTMFIRCHDNLFTESIGPQLLEQGIDGIFLANPGISEDDRKLLHKQEIHAVEFLRVPSSDPWFTSIKRQDDVALPLAVEHLRQLGHERIFLMTYAEQEAQVIPRTFGRLVYEHRLGSPNELTVLLGDHDNRPCWHDVEEFFDREPNPGAMILHDEHVADVVLQSCERRGIAVPDDLSLVVLQDLNPHGHRLPLSAVWTLEDFMQIAEQAGEILMRRIAGEPVDPGLAVVTPKLRMKASSRPAPALRRQ